ncbi:MAG: permease [Epsilonproteobacteria bacterium]|nr:permease [Campylobacterota bacterium]
MKENRIDKQKQPTFLMAVKKATISFFSFSPMILAVIGLVAIFQTYVTPSMLSEFFGHGVALDIFDGTFIGAISSGNGAISYVVAEGLKSHGVSTYALISFILAWTTLSFTHLPAEASVFGAKFTTYRNILTFLCTLIIAYLSVVTQGALL